MGCGSGNEENKSKPHEEKVKEAEKNDKNIQPKNNIDDFYYCFKEEKLP